jgi:hypothetical protein
MGPEKCDKGKDPKECSPEQIKECHGDEKEHSCCKEQDKDKEE